MATGTATMSPGSPVLEKSVVDSFLEVLPDGCVAIDGRGRVVATNRLWRELPRRVEAQRAANAPVGLDYLQLFRDSMAEHGSENAIAGIRSVLNGLTDQFEHQYIRTTSRSIRWFRMTVRPWRQMGAAAIIFHRDISPEKLAQLSTRSGDLEFQALADSSPVLIWMDSPEEGCTFLNRQWLEFTGVPVEKQLGRGWLELIHPNDRGRLLDAYHAGFDQKGDFHAEYRLWHRDGEYRWMKEHGSPRLDAQNDVVGYIGTTWDVSEQKRANEEAFRANRYGRLVREVATIGNSATTLREALQRSVEVISEIMGFPGGHALLVQDDEPDFAKPANIVYMKDYERFKDAYATAAPLTWPAVKDMPSDVLQAGKPSIRDLKDDAREPEKYPRSLIGLAVGLRTVVQLPVLVEDNVEAILEFGSDDDLASDQELSEALTAACERLSRFFERRRAQILLLKKKEELEASAERLFTVAGRLVDSQEEERRRIAREIHDDFTQRLALVSMKIGNLTGRDGASSPEELDASLEEIRKSTTAVASDLRDLSHQLHPAMLGLLGLIRALQAQCEEFQRIRGIQTVFETSISDRDASPQTATCLYRVLQEALMNVAKHSGSSVARVSLDRSGTELAMRIRDQGQGFPDEAAALKGIGLLNMRERVQFLNGTLTVNSSPGNGAEVLVRVPAMPPV